MHVSCIAERSVVYRGDAMKLRFRGAPVAVLLLSLSWPFPGSHAETACESEAAREYLPPLPRGCQKQRISATGEMTFGVLQSPGRLARKAWERQVLFFFGERYLDWEKAACKKVFCVRASFQGSRRCNYTAFPCASDADPAALAALSTRQVPPRGGSHPEARRRAQDRSAAAAGEGGARHSAAARAHAKAAAVGG